MNKLTDADCKLRALIDLLSKSAGFEIAAQIYHTDGGGKLLGPDVLVSLTGLDTPRLTERNGELLHAIEHVAAKILDLDPEEHHRISFDADDFKVNRDRELHRMAEAAITEVRKNRVPHVFPPMMSRERRMLHLALASSGLKSASAGEQSARSVVLYPDGVAPPVEQRPERSPDRKSRPFRAAARRR